MRNLKSMQKLMRINRILKRKSDPVITVKSNKILHFYFKKHHKYKTTNIIPKKFFKIFWVLYFIYLILVA